MDFNFAATVLNSMIALILALCFHEFSHAWVAKLQGDDTAEREGRLTLNPIPHMDPIGTVALPLIGSIIGGFILGWAKPVPVQTSKLKHQKWGSVLVALAGPASNLIFCTISVAVFYMIRSNGWNFEGVGLAFDRLFQQLIFINAILAVFNLLPFPPLDGGHIMRELLPYNARMSYEQYVAPYGMMFILLLLIIPGGFYWMQSIAHFWIRFSEVVVTSFII